MIGMNRQTGAALSGDDHLAQSIADILTTPLGTRPMRRDYGSLLFELIDRPMNPATLLLLVQATVIALARWEPRIAIRQALFSGTFAAGSAALTLIGTRTDGADPTALARLTIPLR